VGPASTAAAAALDNPYASPQVAPHAPYRASYGGEKALAGLGARLGAAFLDALIYMLPLLVGLGFVMISADADLGGMARLFGFLMFIGFIFIVVYQLILLSREGQTLGKKAMNIRIVMYDDGSNPGFGRAVGLRVIVNGLLANVPFYALVDILFIFGAERRCLHDHIAGTKVVEA